MAQASKLARDLKDGTTPLLRVFSSIQRKHPNHRLLLIADQFEEIYTLCHNEEIRRQFLDCLLASLETPTSASSSATVLVTTMRADFLANALSYRPFADVLQNADVKLGLMNREELTEVIEKPAQKLKVTFADGLVERILNDVENQPGNLPLLEFALTELWNKRSGKQLTHKIYEKIGRVEGALARLKQVEAARRKREIRTAWGIAAGSVVAVVISTGLGLMAWKQTTIADSKTKEAELQTTIADNKTKEAELNLANSLARAALSLWNDNHKDLDTLLIAIKAEKLLNKHKDFSLRTLGKHHGRSSLQHFTK